MLYRRPSHPSRRRIVRSSAQGPFFHGAKWSAEPPLVIPARTGRCRAMVRVTAGIDLRLGGCRNEAQTIRSPLIRVQNRLERSVTCRRHRRGRHGRAAFSSSSVHGFVRPFDRPRTSMTFSGSTADRRVSPRAPDIGQRRGNLLVAQRRSERRHQADRPFLAADQNPNASRSRRRRSHTASPRDSRPACPCRGHLPGGSPGRGSCRSRRRRRNASAARRQRRAP